MVKCKWYKMVEIDVNIVSSWTLEVYRVDVVQFVLSNPVFAANPGL